MFFLRQTAVPPGRRHIRLLEELRVLVADGAHPEHCVVCGCVWKGKVACGCGGGGVVWIPVLEAREDGGDVVVVRGGVEGGGVCGGGGGLC